MIQEGEEISATNAKLIVKALLRNEPIADVLAKVLSTEQAVGVVRTLSHRDDILISNWFTKEWLDINTEHWIEFKEFMAEVWEFTLGEEIQEIYIRWLKEKEKL